MRYEDAVKFWAAEKFNLSVADISSVSLEHSKGYGGCDTCGYGGECSVDVYVYYKDKRTFAKSVDSEFSELLKELLAVSAPADPADVSAATRTLRSVEQELAG